MAEKKVATEVAEQEFMRWAEGADLEFKLDGLGDEDKKAFFDSKNTIVRAIEIGILIVDEHGQFVLTPRTEDAPSPITFKEPTGGALMASDQKKKDHDVTKMFAVMAHMTGQNIQRFAAMPSKDLKICQSIISLFLG